MEDTDLSLMELIQVVWKKRKTLAIVFFISALLSAAASFLIKNEYRATAKIFPAKAMDIVMNETGIKRGNISEFGEDEEVEQLLEIMDSRSFKERIIRGQDLLKHYNIKSSKGNIGNIVLQKYSSNVSLDRTRFSAIEINVLDRDPKKAAEIANAIVRELDSYRGEIVEKRIVNTLSYFRKNRDSLQSELSQTSSRLVELNSLGVVSKEERAGLYHSLGQAGIHFNRIREDIEQNKKHSEEFDVLERKRIFLIESLEGLEKNMNQMKGEAAGQLSSKFELQSAIIPDKKAKPKRSVIVFFGALLSTLFVLFLMVLREKWPVYRRILES